MVSVAYVPSMSGCPSTNSRIQVSPSIGSLAGLGSGTAVALATSVGVTGCGPLQATAPMTKRANIGVAAPRVARVDLVVSSFIKRHFASTVVRMTTMTMVIGRYPSQCW